jgi:serine protease
MQRSRLHLRRFLFLTAAGVAAAAAIGLPAQAAPASGQIEGAGAAGAIPGRYIVVLKPDTAQVGTVSADLTARYGGTVQQRYEASIHGFSAAMNESQARRLATDASVALVEQDQTVQVSDDSTWQPSWGLDRIDQRDLPLSWSYSGASTAAGVHAYIIDSGIRTTHVDFAGRARNAWDFASA